MKRYLKIKGAIIYHEYGSGAWSLEIGIQGSDLVSFFMELQLLKFEHTQFCTLNSCEEHNKIIFTLVNGEKISTIEKKGSQFRINLIPNDADFISSYLLQYYRDTLAPVDHIDIEISGINNLTQDGTLVIKTFETKSPMTGDEARKILGIS